MSETNNQFFVISTRDIKNVFGLDMNISVLVTDIKTISDFLYPIILIMNVRILINHFF